MYALLSLTVCTYQDLIGLFVQEVKGHTITAFYGSMIIVRVYAHIL